MANTKKSTASSARNRTQCLLLVPVLASLVWGSTVFGQARDGRELVRAELLTDAANTEKPFTVGIRFTIQHEWYLYWKNPGDAGLPIEVTWELPPGWRAEVPRLPIPSKFVHDDVTAFGYKNEVVLLTTITPDSSKGPLKANLDWLVCRESCLRGGTSVSLDVSKQSSENRAKAARVLVNSASRLPGTQKESGVLIQGTRLSRKGEQWTLNVKLEGKKAGEAKDFYPEIIERVFPDFKSITVGQKELVMTFTVQDDAISSFSLNGLLVTGDSAFEIQIPIQLLSK